jgi:hypothetical protein
MEHLQNFVPWGPDGPRVIPTHGDQLSNERMTDAKRARNANLTKRARLEGLEQVAQEFHHRGILMQVMTVTNR